MEGKWEYESNVVEIGEDGEGERLGEKEIELWGIGRE